MAVLFVKCWVASDDARKERVRVVRIMITEEFFICGMNVTVETSAEGWRSKTFTWVVSNVC